MLIKPVLAASSLEDIYAPGKALGGSSATIANLVNPLINDILIISGLLAFGVIVIAGFNYISASGDKGKTEQAQHMLTYGIIGIVVVAGAFLLTRIAGAILGINLFKP